jgi:molybdopterin synthase catalytic subunit
LEKLYTLDASKIVVLRARHRVAIFEVVAQFARKLGLERPGIFQTEKQKDENFWSVRHRSSNRVA